MVEDANEIAGLTPPSLRDRYGVRQTYTIVRNDGTVQHPQPWDDEKVGAPEQGTDYKLNLRLMARDMGFDPHFKKLHQAILGVAVDEVSGHAYLTQDGPGDWHKIEQASDVIIAKHSDNRGYHSIYHVMDMMGDAGDLVWQAVGDLTDDEIMNLDAKELSQLLGVKMTIAAQFGNAPGYDNYPEVTERSAVALRDAAENILAANFHDIIQKSDRYDIAAGGQDVMVLPQIENAGWPIARHNFKVSVEALSAQSGDVICQYLGVEDAVRDNLKLFTRVTEHQAFFGKNNPDAVREWAAKQHEAGELTHPIDEDTLVRAYRFQRRDVSNFITKDSHGELDFANFDGRISSITTGSGGVAQEEVTDPSEQLLRYKEDRTAYEEMRLWKGMANIADININNRTPMYFDPRAGQDAAIAETLEGMNHDGIEMFGMMKQIAQCRVAACAMVSAAVDPMRRVMSRHSEEALNVPVATLFDALPENKIAPIEVDIATGRVTNLPAEKVNYEALVSGQAPQALDQRVLDQLAYSPNKMLLGADRPAGTLGQMVDVDGQVHNIHKGLIGKGDLDALAMVGKFGYSAIDELGTQTRGWIKANETYQAAVRTGDIAVEPSQLLTVIGNISDKSVAHYCTQELGATLSRAVAPATVQGFEMAG